MNICICGGGNLGHVVAGYVAAKPSYSVSVLTRHPERWASKLEITLPSGTVATGRLASVTSDASQVVPQASIVLICLPGMYIRSELEKIKPFLNATTAVGSVVSSTGFFFQVHDILPGQPAFGFQRVPYISRVTEYGHKASLMGFKKELYAVIENAQDDERLRAVLADMLDTPVKLLENYYEVSLSNSNPLLHTSRLYSMWSDWHEGTCYPRQSLFYEGWTVEAAQLYIDMDDEFQALLDALGVRKGAIPPVLDYYESHDAASLCNKIRSITAFKGIKSPMVETAQGWIPDVNSRYFTEDFGYGLRFIYDLAREKGLTTPSIDKVFDWGRHIIRQ